MIEYQLLGPATPLHRPRFARGKVYNDQKSEMLINYLSIKSQHGKRSLFFEPIHMEVTFVFEVPKSSSKKKQELLINKPYIGKVDVDNLLKKLLDEATGALYINDNIVTSISARKIYGWHAKTLFTVTNIA